MFLSVVIPVYNVEKYLKECLDSVTNQATKLDEEVEILLVDDGSTDLSGVICDAYKEKYPELIKVFHKQNQGLLLTRRYGFEIAQGKYILNCDSDDICEENQFDVVCKVARKTDADVIIFNANQFNDSGKNIWYQNIFTNESEMVVSKDRLIRTFLTQNTVTSMWGKVFKRECLDLKIDYSNFSGYGEDSLQSTEIYSNANTIVYINSALYSYRLESGMTSKFNPDYYEHYSKVCHYMASEKNMQVINNFDELLATKLFAYVGRAITQFRWKKKFSLKDTKEYMGNIRGDKLFGKYVKYFPNVKCDLQADYKVLINLLIKKKYVMIWLLLKVKNLLSK